MPLQLDILDVGQGDGIVVWLPNKKAMMVDYGSTKNKALTQQDSFKYLKTTPFGKGRPELEWLVLTHGDRDHYNMVRQFLTDFGINLRNVLLGGLEHEYGDLIPWLRRRRNPDWSNPPTISSPANPGFFDLANNLGCTVQVLACGVPGRGDHGYVKNTRSAVLRIAYAGRSILLTGDATGDTEQHMISTALAASINPAAVLGATFLKVAHHGSHRTSNRAWFLKCANPSYAFISSDRSGTLNDLGKPTGHRLPQSLTADLIYRHASNLAKDSRQHPYVVSYQRSDYAAYNKHPDIPGDELYIPPNAWAAEWIQRNDQIGIYTTLATMGLGTDADQGVQWLVEIQDNGAFDIRSTEYGDSMDEDDR